MRIAAYHLTGTQPVCSAENALAFLYFTMKVVCTTATNYYKKRYKQHYNSLPGRLGGAFPAALKVIRNGYAMSRTFNVSFLYPVVYQFGTALGVSYQQDRAQG